jgi:GTP-binding protein
MMHFSDEVGITAISGDGGNGCVSFRREKFVPKGGPDGGDGGRGGHVILCASRRIFSLTDLTSRKVFKAANGTSGRGRNQSGKNGKDLIIKVPLGTIIKDCDSNDIIADLILDNQKVVLLSGGKGGKGNHHFTTSTNRTPRFAQPGSPGQQKELKLTLKFIADIGLIGLPNAGKSTLLSVLTTAHPKIDSYPFTTVVPNLGVITGDDFPPLIIADIPGLIKGAGQGRGLGYRFLRHIERTKALLHLLDITYRPFSHILEDFKIIIAEMASYNPTLCEKPQFVLINKTDIYEEGCRDLNELQNALAKEGFESLPVSAKTGKGLDELIKIIRKKLT